jgi:aspartyl-tRNA synthetase
MIRTHEAGTLRPAQAGERVTLAGWVSRRRDHGGVVFIDLRDASGVVQVVFRGEGDDRPEHALRAEFCIEVTGALRLRPAGNENPELPTGEVEVVADEPGGLEVLSEADPLPFPIEGGGELNEDARLRYRYLDIRRVEMAAALRLRSEATYLASEVLRGHGFVYVETPYLTRSTPEGARDFLVPVRLRPGNWYALPQSPQLFKQLLMVGGLERYYQLARCFRDEDFRADRQPEFTQIDLEMSFVDREDVIEVSEDLVGRLWAELAGYRVPRPIPRMTYAEAMRRFGSDKPDLRLRAGRPDRLLRPDLIPRVPGSARRGRGHARRRRPDAPGTGRLAGMGTRPRRARPGLRADRSGRGGVGVGAGRAASVGHRKAGPGGRGRRGARGLRLLRGWPPRAGP